MKRSIKDTYVYKVLDLESTVKSCGEINADLDKYKLNQDIVDAILNEFKFKISFPAKIRIIEEIKAGKITFVDTPAVANLPTWLISRDGVSIQTAVVNLFGKIKVKEDGTAQFNEAGTRPSAKFSNITTWGQNHLESERIALNAMRARTNAMTKYCEKMMKFAAEKTGGKVVEK